MSDRPSASNIAIGGSGAQTSILFQALQAPSPCDFKVALKVGLRCLLRSADPACNTAATCRPCRPAASMRTLQQACRPCSSLMQQACRPLPCSKPTARLSASLQTLQQPAAGNLQTLPHAAPTDPTVALQQACKTCCLPLPQPAWLPVFNYLGIFLHSHRVHFPL